MLHCAGMGSVELREEAVPEANGAEGSKAGNIDTGAINGAVLQALAQGLASGAIGSERLAQIGGLADTDGLNLLLMALIASLEAGATYFTPA